MKTRQARSPSASRQRNARPPPVFPDDLIVEILSWIPVKSLLQFRCVCKLWKSVISDPNFVKLHHHRSRRNANLLLLWENFAEGEWDVESIVSIVPCSVRSLLEMGNPWTIDGGDCYSLTDETGYEVVGSCNGLVCLQGDNDDGEYCFYLWNPATKLASKDLTCLPACDSYFNRFRFAFGYDNLSDTYKLVAFMFDGKAKEESQKVQVKICNLSDNCWRNIHSFPVIPFDTPHVSRRNNGVYFNGTLNWLALCNINSDDDYEWNDTVTITQLVIVSLDLGMETYTQLLLPRVDEAPQAVPTIGLLMDCLYFSYDCKGTHCVIWQMKDFGVEKSWTQFMKVSYQDLQIDCLPYSFPLVPLCSSENGDILIMIMTTDEFQPIMYHPRDNRVERTDLPHYICWKYTMDYVESLVSPCCNVWQICNPSFKDIVHH